MAASGPQQPLPARGRDRLYLEVQGQRWPTRDSKQGPEEQGYREARAVLAFCGHEGAEMSKERHEILPEILQAKITDSETFRPLFAEVYRPAGGERAGAVRVPADGARWSWGMGEDLLPQAVQILDSGHAQQYLWDAGELIYGAGSALVGPWVKEQETLLLADQVEQALTHPERLLALAPALAPLPPHFQQHASRMRYGT